jgi:phosphoribosyl 1,2-cyclic phosphate phosphodiesterase
MTELTFLGTGTSMGVPMIGCDCKVCSSTDFHDKRSRSSILISSNGRNILVDTTTDLYYQALRCNVRNVDAVLFTHSHADHVHGIDELRRFNHIQGEEITCYGRKETIKTIRSIFKYIFLRKEGQFDIPQLRTEVVDGTINLFGVEITPIEIYHGKQSIYGYRFFNCAYLTDCSGIPESSMEKLTGLDVLIIDALRYAPHKNHFSYDEALDMIERLSPKTAYLTHLTHDYLYEEMPDKLPENVKLPYDGLIIEI